jgi:non-ribosomal peptide synthetase component F
MPSETTARELTDRLDALASALRAAGVSPEQSARLLASAAEATMHAVTLDVLLEGSAVPVGAVETTAHDPLKLAA